VLSVLGGLRAEGLSCVARHSGETRSRSGAAEVSWGQGHWRGRYGRGPPCSALARVLYVSDVTRKRRAGSRDGLEAGWRHRSARRAGASRGGRPAVTRAELKRGPRAPALRRAWKQIRRPASCPCAGRGGHSRGGPVPLAGGVRRREASYTLLDGYRNNLASGAYARELLFLTVLSFSPLWPSPAVWHGRGRRPPALLPTLAGAVLPAMPARTSTGAGAAPATERGRRRARRGPGRFAPPKASRALLESLDAA
jgi:hypothetical protein